MLPLRVRTEGDPILRQVATVVSPGEFGRRLDRFASRMLIAMDVAGGIGLAAPQVGLSRRLFVARVGRWSLKAANPVIVASGPLVLMTEGCLSVPGVFVELLRPSWVRVSAQDPSTARRFELTVDGLAARVVLHEVDHLDGLLIGDGR